MPIYNNPRGTSFGRGGKPFSPHQRPQPERPLPPSYVCYRCGQKGQLFTIAGHACFTHEMSQAIGYKIAQQIAIASSIINLE